MGKMTNPVQLPAEIAPGGAAIAMRDGNSFAAAERIDAELN